MALIDLWYLPTRGPDNKRIPSKRYGCGKRYRVDYLDAAGHPRSRSFAHKPAAKDFDTACRAGVAAEVNTARAATRLTFPEYAARWRAAREFSWEVETRRRIPSNIAYHLNPAFSDPSERSPQPTSSSGSRSGSPATRSPPHRP